MNYNVVIVEDDLMVSAILERQLAKFPKLKLRGKFRSGSEALSFLAEKPDAADLVVLDYYMPEMNGIDFLAALRKHDKEIQVIMITSANDYEIIRDAVCLGVCDYVLKPFTTPRLERAVDRFETVVKLKNETHVWTQEKVDQLLFTGNSTQSLNAEDSREMKANKINPMTLANIRDYMRLNQDKLLPLIEISEGLGLSTVTVRRYLKHLNASGEVSITLNCKTGGRPSEMFRYKPKYPEEL